MSGSKIETSDSPELIVTRVLDAPRELVWEAWADAKKRVQWMGPANHPAVLIEDEFRVGTPFRCCMRAEDGGEGFWHGGVYREIVKPERMVFTFAWEGDDGKPENEMLITLTLAEEGGKTKMTFHQTLFLSVEQRDRHNGGWNSTFDRLENFLAK